MTGFITSFQFNNVNSAIEFACKSFPPVNSRLKQFIIEDININSVETTVSQLIQTWQ